MHAASPRRDKELLTTAPIISAITKAKNNPMDIRSKVSLDSFGKEISGITIEKDMIKNLFLCQTGF
jgi:hypothetical protein